MVFERHDDGADCAVVEMVVLEADVVEHLAEACHLEEGDDALSTEYVVAEVEVRQVEVVHTIGQARCDPRVHLTPMVCAERDVRVSWRHIVIRLPPHIHIHSRAVVWVHQVRIGNRHDV